MSEVIVVAAITAKPGMRDQVEALARDVAIDATHREEGCITYALHRDVRDHDRVVFVERWISQEALDAHLQMPHLQAFIAAVGALAVGPPDLYVLEACGYGEPGKGVLGPTTPGRADE